MNPMEKQKKDIRIERGTAKMIAVTIFILMFISLALVNFSPEHLLSSWIWITASVMGILSGYIIGRRVKPSNQT